MEGKSARGVDRLPGDPEAESMTRPLDDRRSTTETRRQPSLQKTEAVDSRDAKRIADAADWLVRHSAVVTYDAQGNKTTTYELPIPI